VSGTVRTAVISSLYHFKGELVVIPVLFVRVELRLDLPPFRLPFSDGTPLSDLRDRGRRGIISTSFSIVTTFFYI
jgi:hypothetical protein